MKKSRLIVIVLSVLIVVMLIVCGILIGLTKGSSDVAKEYEDDDVTKYEWMEQLADYSGAINYNQKEPYFTDVTDESEYFNIIQAAVEWEYISAGKEFRGDEKASVRFVAVTAIKSIGEAKLQIYLETTKELEEDDYLKIAIDNGIIEEKKLNEGVSVSEAEEIIKLLDKLYFNTLWPADVEEIEYLDSVIMIDNTDVINYNKQVEEITIQNNALEVGDVFIFNDGGFVTARKVSEILDDGSFKLELPSIEECVDDLVQSDIAEFTFQDIKHYYGEENLIVVDRGTLGKCVPVSTIAGEITDKGFKIEAKEENDKLVIYVTDNNTGIKYQLPISQDISEDYKNFGASLEIDKIFVGTQIKYNLSEGVEYADVAVDINSKLGCAFSAEEKVEKKIRLFETPTPLGNGVVGVGIKFSLVIGLKGELSLEAELPFENTVHYEKGKGIRYIKHELEVERPKLEASLELSAKVRTVPVLVVLNTEPILDVEIDLGVSTKAEVKTQGDGAICSEVGIGFPTLAVMVGDEEIAYCGKQSILAVAGIKAEWEIIDYDKAPIKFEIHAESLPDGTKQYPEKCTYEEDSKERQSKQEDKNTSGTTEDDILTALQNGDFSEFAGSYTPLEIFHDWYGGGEKVRNLNLDKDGVITGGGAVYSENPYLAEKPISVTKQEDGSYYCVVQESVIDHYDEQDIPEWSQYGYEFYIYPIGTVGTTLYGADEQFLKDVTYIHYIKIGGGVMDVIYYLDEENDKQTTSVIKNYKGVDWVDAKELTIDATYEMGATFVSGTGITYTILAEEGDDDSGRPRLVIMNDSGERFVIPNIINFLLDSETGISYYNIVSYVSMPDYTVYQSVPGYEK